MSHRRTKLIAAAALGAAAAVPATASAAVTATFDQGCYSNVPTQGTQPITAQLTGGTPNGTYQLFLTGKGEGEGSVGSVDGTFDAAGNATAQITGARVPNAGIDPTPGVAVDAAVTEFATTGPVTTPVSPVRLAVAGLAVGGRADSPTAKRRVQVGAAPYAGLPLFGFVTKPGSSKVLRRVSLGKGNACGYASKRAVVAPKVFRTGNYRFYINPGNKLRKSAAIYSSFRLFRR